MLRLNTKNFHLSRTIVPEYPGNPWACKLHPDWDRSVDILPGTVMTRLDGEHVKPMTKATEKPWGLAALFVAPSLGIDECAGTDNFAVWVGEGDTCFRIKAPAFDDTATWENSTDGTKTPVYANANGKISTTAFGDPVGTLVDAQVDKGFVRVSLDTNHSA